MTRDDWDECREPSRMLAFLGGRGSDRKRRLFACACCRSIWDLLTDERLRAVVEATEQVVDGRLEAPALAIAREAAFDAFRVAKRAEWVAEAEANFTHTPEYDATCAFLFAAAAAVAVAVPSLDRGVDLLDAYGWPPPEEGGPDRERSPRPSYQWAATAAVRAWRAKG